MSSVCRPLAFLSVTLSVPAMVGVTGSHHVLGIEDQLGELGPAERLLLLVVFSSS